MTAYGNKLFDIMKDDRREAKGDSTSPYRGGFRRSLKASIWIDRAARGHGREKSQADSIKEMKMRKRRSTKEKMENEYKDQEIDYA